MAQEICKTCNGQGWLNGPDESGRACPDCLNDNYLGGTGFAGGALPEHLPESRDIRGPVE